MRTTSVIHFFFEAPVTLKERTRLKEFITRLFKKEGRDLESLNYIFCSDDKLLEINKSYLQHDYYTDIITFDLGIEGTPTVGEVYISVDRVRDNAFQHKTTFTEELHRVIFHGALHLCGYKDKSRSDQAVMRKMEEKYLGLYLSQR